MSAAVRVTNTRAMALAATHAMSRGSENVAPPAVIATPPKRAFAASAPREALDPPLVHQCHGTGPMAIDNGMSLA